MFFCVLFPIFLEQTTRLFLKKYCEESLKDVVGDHTFVCRSFTIAKENID